MNTRGAALTGGSGQRPIRLFARLATALALLAACAQKQETSAEPQTVDSQALGVRLLLPADPWTVVSDEAQRLVLDDGSGGHMTLHLGEESEQTPNIVEAVRGKLAEYDALDGGGSFGGQQFQAPVGLVYTARGRYPDPDAPGETVGEITGYTVHPAGGRFLLLTYAYPGDADPAPRYDNLLSLLGSLEPLSQEPAPE